MQAYGLQSHIWNNNLRSILLLAGFPVLLLLLMYGLFLLFAGVAGAPMQDGVAAEAAPFIWAAEAVAGAWPYALIGAGLWFVIAYFFYQGIIDASTGAKPVTRLEEPRAYTLLENLCISRGMTPPALRVMETPSLNAFATGLHEGQYSITVTQGLLATLEDDELEAVLAHELTHIRNQDVRLLVVAVIFVGIFSFVFEMLFRSFGQGNFRMSSGGSSSRSSDGDGDSGGSSGPQMVAILVGLVCIALAYALAIVIRFTLSRKREYLADAGAVELTKNPDAMISALRKVAGNAEVADAPSEVKEMFLENPHAGFGEMFATHPPIERRIAVLMRYAGGRDDRIQSAPQPPSFGRRTGPWG